jgi:hypothetical protein
MRWGEESPNTMLFPALMERIIANGNPYKGDFIRGQVQQKKFLLAFGGIRVKF